MAKAKAKKAKAKTTMTRDEFWAEVARIGWGTKTTDHRAVKIAQLRKGEAHCDGMREHFKEVDSALYRETDMGGGDSADDCRRHIVGLGKAEYDKVMAKPHLAEKRYKSGDYRESFAYCIPYDSDFEDLKPDRYVEWAARNVEELGEHVDAVRAADHELGIKILTLIEIHRLIEAGNIEDALEREAEARHLVEVVKKDWGALIKGLGGSFRWNEWGVLNLFSDLRKRAEVMA